MTAHASAGVYQEAEADGFNRQEVFNLYLNPFTTPAHTYREREQYLLMREKFRDKTTLADLTASYDFGPAELTQHLVAEARPAA